MRKVLIVLAASATASLASASQFSTTNPGINAGTQPMPAIDTTEQSTTPLQHTAIPAPGSAVIAIAGLAMLGRRRRQG